MLSEKLSKWIAYHPKTVAIICLLLGYRLFENRSKL